MFRRTQGASPRLWSAVTPPAPKTRRQWLAWLLVVGLLVGTGQILSEVAARDQFPLRQISVAGLPAALTEAELTGLLQDQLGVNILRLDLAELQQRLLAEPWIAAAELQRHWPDHLSIHLQARHAVAYWGEEGLLDADAQIFHPAQRPKDQPWPILYGTVEQAEELLQTYQLFSRSLSPLGLVIETLYWDEYGNRRLILPSGLTLELGSRDGLVRVQRFVELYPEVLQPRLSELAAVDLRYPDGAALRWIEWPDNETSPAGSGRVPERLRQLAGR